MEEEYGIGGKRGGKGERRWAREALGRGAGYLRFKFFFIQVDG